MPSDEQINALIHKQDALERKLDQLQATLDRYVAGVAGEKPDPAEGTADPGLGQDEVPPQDVKSTLEAG